MSDVLVKRFNNKDAFCLVPYNSKHGMIHEQIKVWNSRDGAVPNTFQHPRDGRVWTRDESAASVCAPDRLPTLGELLIDDASSKGDPVVKIATASFCETYRRKYGTPFETIKRLDRQIAEMIGKHQQEMTDLTCEFSDEEDRLKAKIAELEAKIVAMNESIAFDKVDLEHLRNEKQLFEPRLEELRKEIARLKPYEEAADAFMAALANGFKQDLLVVHNSGGQEPDVEAHIQKQDEAERERLDAAEKEAEERYANP